MKLTDYALVFIIIFVCFSFKTDSNMRLNGKISVEQQNYNRALDTALSDSMFMLVELDDGTNVEVNIEKAVDSFLISLCVNLGLGVTEQNKNKIKEYVPVMLFVLNDKCVAVRHNYGESDNFYIEEPEYYIYEDDKYTYYMRLNEELILFDGGNAVEGSVDNIGFVYTDSIAADKEIYERKKSEIIIDIITSKLKECTNYKYNIEGNSDWDFYIPYGEDDVWNRTIKDIGVMAVFTGYPYSNSSLGHYSKFAFGGARIWKRE